MDKIKKTVIMKAVLAACLLLLAGCALPPPDQPAHFVRMGRFVGLVANCGCSDITPDRMRADYAQTLGGRYSAAEITAMKGYVDLAASEQWQNRSLVCAEVCSQACMVQSVVEPLGGRRVAAVGCLVNERDLHLTDGSQLDQPGSGRD
ncbi:hypothetical protein A6A04_16650 [Paramagnetospirillum marisnigri]|uniref:Lipoprotein n=1 Tax=Paramagnetospirillum marisnigri TaxID=1285242 RepID=A0A178MQE6_9PROT|nr:hypothetical protein [Paramagnetospirillum marisnigri]OAN51279.1 hypothetical protein A6A04_16650 [Paramagnetospirillum marisnigri]